MHIPFICDFVRAVLTSVQGASEHVYIGEATDMRITVWPNSHRGNVGFLAIWSASKAPCTSCLLDDLFRVSVQTLSTEICTPSYKNSEVCKTHLQKPCCYLRVCIFLCCQVANLRYAEFNIRFRWLVRCWLNGENSRKTRSWSTQTYKFKTMTENLFLCVKRLYNYIQLQW
jgi:hypothetical protein